MNADTPPPSSSRIGCGAIIALLLLMVVLAAFGFGYLSNFDMQQLVRSLPWSG
jgi:hypothetical protein